jgi:hypothetical protein
MKLVPFLMALSAAVTFGFFIGVSFPVALTPKVEKEKFSGIGFSHHKPVSSELRLIPCMQLQCGVMPWSSSSAANYRFNDSNIRGELWAPFRNSTTSNATSGVQRDTQCLPIVKVAKNPQGAERLPPGIVVSESDLHLRRLWGSPTEVVISLTLNLSHCTLL